MYNYYLHEKKMKQFKEEKEKLSKEQEMRQTKRNLNEKLVENYEKRIENFILTMASKPLVIKDYHNPVESTRFEFLKEAEPSQKKGFIFKGYQTEKERIKKYLDERQKIVNESWNNRKTNESQTKYVQPNMRFKPRTDLERIVEVINDYNYGRASTEAVKKQLKSLDLNYMKKLSDESEEESDYSPTRKRESTYKGEIHDKHNRNNASLPVNDHDRETELKAKSLNKYKSRRRKVDNSGAKSLMKEYHFKTHFKAAAVIASRLNNLETNNNLPKPSFQPSKTFSNFNSKFSSSNRIRNIDTSNPYEDNFNSTENLLQKFARKFPLDEDNLDIIEANPLLYQLNFNPVQKGSDEIETDQGKLNYLKRLSENKEEEKKTTMKGKFNYLNKLKNSKRKNNCQIGESPVTFFKNFNDQEIGEYEKKEEEKVWVNNELIPRSQVDLIAKKILENCNFTHKKSKNNPNKLKKGEGKLMITSGMTLQEFNQKMRMKGLQSR